MSNFNRKNLKARLIRGSAILFLATLGSVLHGAPPAAKQPGSSGGGTAGDKNVVIMSLNDYNPLSATDGRVALKNLTFDRRYAPNGAGNFLDVSFEIWNRTTDPVQLYAYVVAFTETNAVNKRYRRWVPYPTWRKYDPDRTDHFILRDISITPKDIESSRIWNKKDSEYRLYKHLVDREKEAPVPKLPVNGVLPPFWKYLNYLSFYPTRGLRIEIPGNIAPKDGQNLITNYKEPSAEEKARLDFSKLVEHKYTVERLRRKVVFRSFHYMKFKEGQKFFNTLTVLLFEVPKADNFQKELEAFLPRKKSVQGKRADIDKRVHLAEKNEDNAALDQLSKENLVVRKEEIALSQEIKAVYNKYKPLLVQKTIRIPRFRRR